MNMFVNNILLALAWAAISGDMSPGTLTLGFVFGYAILAFAQPLLGTSRYFGTSYRALRFGLFFIWELLVSNVRVAWLVIKGPSHTRPGVIAIPLRAELDLEITMFANLITLTPGTLSLDLSDDRKTLYVHALNIEDADSLREEIKKGLEDGLLEVLR
ncbi:MAG: Na+/H+ antiporter subunit E [Planctomycetota bacterium]|jgi:multicomponent Na+:H+ antiporter subunit E